MSRNVHRYCTFSGTRVTTEEFVHTWEISNFRALQPGIGKFLTSTGVINHQDVWLMKLYAEGYDGSSKDFLGISLSFRKKLVEIELSPYLLLVYFLDKDEREYQVYRSEEKIEDIVVPKLIQRSYLLNERNDLLPDGNLLLRFKICFNADAEVPSKSIVIAPGGSYPRLRALAAMFNQEKFSDVEIVAGGRVFWAYKGMLASQSPVFAAMFGYDMRENRENRIEIEDVEPEVVLEMLRFVYLGEVHDVENVVCDLFATADKYEIQELKDTCEEALIKYLSMDTVIYYLILADQYQAPALKDKALEFFKTHGRVIVKTEDFKKNLIKLLSIIPEIIETILITE